MISYQVSIFIIKSNSKSSKHGEIFRTVELPKIIYQARCGVTIQNSDKRGSASKYGYKKS